MLNVSVFELKPTNGQKSFYGKAEIICVKNGCYLRSYDTIVCAIDDSGKFIRYWWGYSATTMKHIEAFLKLYGLPGGGKSWWQSLPINKPVWLTNGG
jgi:hypothetical protein